MSARATFPCPSRRCTPPPSGCISRRLFSRSFRDLTPTEKQNGLAGLANVLRTVAALLLMCDPRDLGIAISEDISESARSFEPDLFLFDNYPGGIGQSQPLFALTARLLASALDVLQGCSCDAGCPACVGPIGEVGERGKEAALEILKKLLVSG